MINRPMRYVTKYTCIKETILLSDSSNKCIVWKLIVRDIVIRLKPTILLQKVATLVSLAMDIFRYFSNIQTIKSGRIGRIRSIILK